MPNKTQKKISVIIADDDFTIRDAFRECVKDSRYEIVAEAEDGMTVLEAARKIKPDMAVLDIEMPVADGIAACGILMKENLVHCTVMLTSFETGDYINAAIESGAEGYITKPFERGQLLSVLDMCYAQSKERYMLKKDCTNLKRKLDSKEITNKAKLIVIASEMNSTFQILIIKKSTCALKQKPTPVLAYGAAAPVLLQEQPFVCAQITPLRWMLFSMMLHRNILTEITSRPTRLNATAKRPTSPDPTLAVYSMMKLLHKSRKTA